MKKTFLPHDVVETVLRLCEDLATPRCLTVAILVRYREWDQLASLSVDPLLYSSADHLKSDLAASSFLRKCVDLPTTVDRKAAAVRGFFDCEKECCLSNVRLEPLIYGMQSHPDDGRLYELIALAKKFLSRLLGRAPTVVSGRFGPGSTYGDSGEFATVPHKMSSSPTFTTQAIPCLFPWIQSKWAKALMEDNPDWTFPDSCRGNRFTTVPKDCTKDRGIAIEPSINLFYQLGYGRLLKRRLRRAGLNLAKGQDIHRQVVCEASIRRHLCTLDLSNASDTICKNLVKLLLPPDWFDVLDSLRSHYTLVEGQWYRLEKFSSMGNGFTFELETCIFLALVHATLEANGHKPIVSHDVFVFGDDIIVPNEFAQEVMAVLRFFGLTINKKKSFFSGDFRESCGGDFFRGVNVRPYFMKELPYEPQHYISVANGIRSMAIYCHAADYFDDRYRRAWFTVLDCIPSNVRRCRGPEELGDLVIHDHQTRWSIRKRNCITYVSVYRPHRFKKVKWDRFSGGVVLASALYGVGGDSEGIIPRGDPLSFKVGWTPLS